MKRGIVCVLAAAFLLPAAFGNKQKKIDPKLKAIRAIFVKGNDEVWVKEARANLEYGKCFHLDPNEGSADAVMTVRLSTETQSIAVSNPAGAVSGGGVWAAERMNRTTVILSTHQGDKLKKVWSNSIDLIDREEAWKSGVRRLIDKLREEACAEP